MLLVKMRYCVHTAATHVAEWVRQESGCEALVVSLEGQRQDFLDQIPENAKPEEGKLAGPAVFFGSEKVTAH